jgi:hypothetical protein
LVVAGVPVAAATAIAMLVTAGAASAAVPGPEFTPAASPAVTASPMIALAKKSTTKSTPPPTLSGENLGQLFTTNGVTITAASCKPNGNSWFTYTVNGTATGPYAGTFSEQGLVDVSPQTQTVPPDVFPGPAGSVAGALAHFSITSPAGTVQGLAYAPPASGLFGGTNLANCLPAGGVTRSPAQHIYQAGANIEYAATIHPPSGGWYTDTGSTNLLVDEETGFIYPNGPNTQDFLYEDFSSNGSSTNPLL